MEDIGCGGHVGKAEAELPTRGSRAGFWQVGSRAQSQAGRAGGGEAWSSNSSQARRGGQNGCQNTRKFAREIRCQSREYCDGVEGGC